MVRVLIVLILLPTALLGQNHKTPSDTARMFLQAVGKGELESAEKQVYKLLIVDGKVHGTSEGQPQSTALKALYDSGFQYHKELSVETSKDLSRVFVEMIRLPDVDVFEILLIRSGQDWKISGWRRLSPPVEIPRPLVHPSFPNGVPFQQPCPTCT